MTRIPRPMPALAAACWAAVIFASPAAAQIQVGRLVGTVKNEVGQPVKAATIRAINPTAIPSEFTTTSDQKGNWSILGLRSGIWEVTASAPGFESTAIAVRVALGMNNPQVEIVLVGTPVKGAMDGVDTKRLQSMLGNAESLMLQEKWDEAVAEYRSILTLAPSLDTVNLAIGRALSKKKDHAGAAAAYGEVLKRDAGNQRALVGLGRAQHEQGNRAAAIASLEQAVAVDGGTNEAREARAILAEIRK